MDKPNTRPLHHIINGPHTIDEMAMTVSDIIVDGTWKKKRISELLILKEVENNIKAIYIPRNLNQVDTLTWSLTPHGFFSKSSAYKHVIDKHSMAIHNTKDNHSMIIQNTWDNNWIWSRF
ncbi:hypothetical protein RDI58_001009 [Solanum bulbocastanum]|uniref:Uncharacterized protein n=1 Tax=Solanum bulbocastanum TaxID=147425 RepID=A0AAN8UB60_SOLBU